MSWFRRTLMKWWIITIAALALVGGALLLAPTSKQLVSLKPELPIDIEFGKSAVGTSIVATFHNKSEKTFALRARYENKTLGKTKDDALRIGPYESTKRGWLEDCEFFSGDTITLSHEDYREKVQKVP